MKDLEFANEINAALERNQRAGKEKLNFVKNFLCRN